jgi:lipase (class 3)
MPPDKDVADLCVGIYAYPGLPAATWDRFDDGKDSDQICWGVKIVDDCDVLVFRGSTTFEDWRRDFNVWADPSVHSKIGPVHPGFLDGLDQVLQEYQEFRGNPGRKLVVAGHSLGAGRASILCGLAIVAGIVPAGRVVFGEPRPGFPALAQLLSSIPDSRSYRNGKFNSFEHDLVTDVPVRIGPLQYVHPTRLIEVSALPPPDDEWGVFSYHHMQLYARALAQGSIRPAAAATA